MKPPPPNALVNKSVALTLAFLMFSGTLGLGAVWMRQEIFATANQNRVIEGQLADVTRKLDEIRAQIATAESVHSLLEKNRGMHLALAMPQERQVVRVESDPSIELARKRNAEALMFATASADNFNGTASNDLTVRFERASYRR
jgi:hypothetical protein